MANIQGGNPQGAPQEQLQPLDKPIVNPKKIFVGNLPPDTLRDDLRELANNYGRVIDCDVIRSGRYGFVTFLTEYDAGFARHRIDQKLFRDYPLRATMAENPKQKPISRKSLPTEETKPKKIKKTPISLRYLTPQNPPTQSYKNSAPVNNNSYSPPTVVTPVVITHQEIPRQNNTYFHGGPQGGPQGGFQGGPQGGQKRKPQRNRRNNNADFVPKADLPANNNNPSGNNNNPSGNNNNPPANNNNPPANNNNPAPNNNGPAPQVVQNQEGPRNNQGGGRQGNQGRGGRGRRGRGRNRNNNRGGRGNYSAGGATPKQEYAQIEPTEQDTNQTVPSQELTQNDLHSPSSPASSSDQIVNTPQQQVPSKAKKQGNSNNNNNNYKAQQNSGPEEFEVTVGNTNTKETTLRLKLSADKLKDFMVAIQSFLPVEGDRRGDVISK